MDKKLTYQELIIRLQRFWADQGCVIWQPYSEKVGAGTMNSATVLRVLGPEPWNVAYVEPSFRPDDGRFAENPNRMQMHMQYQVILKPDPGNPQELYLQSLAALGIDTRVHDIRFVEDNWESPALGAWGLGWEVWLDGMEITQFTYFQQAGGMPVDPVAVELTYGLERIATYLQGVQSVWDLQWNENVSYGDALKRQEVEYCEYAFNAADVGRMKKMYDLFVEEADACLERRLVVPAHDYVIRCSHTFNVLDTRGAIGVTERARYFGQMRDLSRQVAEAYAEQREEMGHPLTGNGRQETGDRSASLDSASAPPGASDFVLEIGCEELPAGDVPSGLEQLQKLLGEQLEEARLPHERLTVRGTPRRLTAVVKGLAAGQEDEATWVRGPAVKAAYDDDGNPTRALEGFCRGNGVSPDSVEKRADDKGVEYVYALRETKGKPAGEVLMDALPKVVGGISFQRSMRWDSDGVAFSRPVRWIVALLGEQVIPFSYARLTAGQTSRGIRRLGSPDIDIPSADGYETAIAEAGIILDAHQRKASIREQVEATAAQVEGVVDDDEDLLEEVTQLVEAPAAVLGSYSESHLELPEPVLTTVMKKYQRYFPVRESSGGKLMPYFITLANGTSDDPDVVAEGNARVVRARYADAGFFFEEDTQQSLEAFLPRLDTLAFQEDLGSVLDKSKRIENLLGSLSQELGLSGDELAAATRAAKLCKADLATNMVVEMTSLQGIMGREYARASGEPEAVAQAIEDHYHPRFPGDTPPSTTAGFGLSVVDRLDSLAGLFCVGIRPRSTADPYGLRRDAIGLLTTLIRRGHPFSLTAGLKKASEQLPVPVEQKALDEALEFVLRRLEVVLRDEGHPFDIVDAAISGGCDDPYEITRIVAGLRKMVGEPDWLENLHAFSRCARIVREMDEQLPLTAGADSDTSTASLLAAYESAAAVLEKADDRIGALHAVMVDLRAPINQFFEDVMVMAKEDALREARLSLMQHIAALPGGIADLSRLEGF